MKKKVGELYDKPIVVGNSNEITKGEILLNNNNGEITLSERKEGELEAITSTPPKYPRCFIWYDLGDEGYIGEAFPLHYYIGDIYSFEMSYEIVISNCILFDQQFAYTDDGSVNIDSFLSRHRGKYKEISFKEYMGECPEGDFGIIRIPMYIDPSGQVIYTLVDDELSKKRINYLKNTTENKYNKIQLYNAEGDSHNRYYATSKSYTIDKENNCIIFEVNPIPPFGMATQIKVSIDAEVSEQ
jgi:hypothetical protein